MIKLLRKSVFLSVAIKRISSAIKFRKTRTYERLVNLVLVGMIVASIIIPILDHFNTMARYKLTDQIVSILNGTSPAMAERISYDKSKQMYQFNKQGTKNSATPSEPSQELGVGNGSKLYSADIYKDGKKGVTLYDTVNETQISFAPLFKTESAEQSGNHFVLPLDTQNPRLIYTAKANGLKEDIVLTSPSSSDIETFTYRLTLPVSLEARLTDGGDIGIYSADTSLYGNISYGSDADRQRIDQARKNAKKDHLAFFIPSPIINQTNPARPSVSAKFNLDGDNITVTASGLKHASYPLSIDPSVVVASSTNFHAGNGDEIDFDDANNQIRRLGLTGGNTTGSLTSSTPAGSSGTFQPSSAIWNNVLYVIDGQNGIGSNVQKVYRATITPSTGALGSWTSQSINIGVPNRSVAAYNGKLYLISNASGSYYAPINADASLGSLVSVSSPPNINGNTWATSGSEGLVAYNGYLYTTGEASGSSVSSAFYVAINGDGTLGTWQSTTSMPGYHARGALLQNNGYIYYVGGTNGSSWYNTTYYTKINPNGSLGTCSGSTWCTATNSFTNGRESMGAAIYGGYIYILGGCASVSQPGVSNCLNSSSGVGATAEGPQYSDMQYAPVYANGDIGAWKTGGFTRNGSSFPLVATANHLYAVSGDYMTSSNCPGALCTNTINFVPSVDSIAISPAGEVTSSTTDTGGNFATPRFYHAAIAYNGYLYISGGCTASSCLTPASDIQFAPINSDGSVGTWTTSSNTFTTGRYGHAMAAYNGYLYILGGKSAVTEMNDVQYAGINTDGTLDSFTLDTGTSFSARHGFAFAQNGGNFYVIGGRNGNTNLNDVWYSGTNGGAMVNWQQDTSSSFANPRREFSAAIWGGYIYIVNGSDGTNVFNNVQYAKINDDNTLGTWASTNNFGVTSYSHQIAAVKGYLYFLGGCVGGGCSGYTTGVKYKKINADGTLDSATNSVSSAFSAQRTIYASAVSNDNLYMTGGCTGTTASSDTSCASIQGDTQYTAINNGGDGTLGAWSSETSLNSIRGEHSAVAYNGHIYVMGGCSSYDASYVCTRTASIEYAKITSNGSLTTPAGCGSTWCVSSVSLPEARRGLTSLAVNGYLYIFGGDTASGDSNSVRYAAINSDGSLGSTWFTGPNLLTARWHHATTLAKGYIYNVGGRTASTTLKDTEYAKLASDGTIGSWAVTGSDIRSYAGLFGHSTFAIGSRLYITGGSFGLADSSTRTSALLYSDINSDGTLASGWNSVLVQPFIFPRNTPTWVVNGNVYLSSEYGSGMYFAPLTGAAKFTTWVNTNGFNYTHDYGASVSWNGNLYSIGGCTAYGADASPDYYNCSAATASVSRTRAASIARTAHYSKLFDLDVNATPTRFSVNNGIAGVLSSISLQYQSSLSGAGFGSSSGNTVPVASSPIVLATTQARYWALSLTLDDSQGSVFPDSASSQTTISSLELFYHAASPERLLHGKTFTTEVKRSLDTEGP